MIKVFVGCAANGEDIESQMVLENSLRRHCSKIDLDITWMKLSRDNKSVFSNWKTNLWSTPFSGFRWAVPELCNFQGKAIYMDSDIIVRSDIATLWYEDFQPGKIVIAKGGTNSWRFCVSLWDCEAAKEHLLTIDNLKSKIDSHKETINYFKKNQHLIQSFSTGNWNCIDGENYPSINNPDIKILHYSSEAHQPHLRYAIPRLRSLGRSHWFDGDVKRHWRPEIEELFDKEFLLAKSSGYSIDQYEPEQLYGSYVKKSEKNYKSHEWAR